MLTRPSIRVRLLPTLAMLGVLGPIGCGDDSNDRDEPRGRHGDFATEGIVGGERLDGGLEDAGADDGGRGLPSRCRGAATRVRYVEASVAFGERCQAETQQRACRDGQWGAWSGDATHDDCVMDPPEPCDVVMHGLSEYRIRFAAAQVPEGDTCEFERQMRTCEEGLFTAWNGSFSATSCRVVGPVAPPTCGDGAVDNGEACDDGNRVTEACAYDERACQVCDASCQLVAGAVSYCGDGAHDPAHEACDDGPNPSAQCAYGLMSCLVCNPSCLEVAGTTSYCGDGVIDVGGGEACDDGAATASCDAQCQCIARPEVCDGLDNDCNGQVDDLDAGGDGIRDCLRILVLGTPGQNPSSNFQVWIAEQGTTLTRIHNVAPAPELVAATLTDYDVVILDRLTRSYTAQESATLLAWVEAGGGLMSLSGYDGSLSRERGNTLLSTFGVEYESGLLSEDITNLAAHPLNSGLTTVSFQGGHHVLDLTGAAGSTAVAFDRNGMPVARALERSAGRAYVWGDEWVTFDSEWRARPEILQFWVNAFAWLEGELAS